MKQELWKYSAIEMFNLFKRKVSTPLEVAQSIIDRKRLIDNKINAFVCFDEENILSQAKLSTYRWEKNIIKGPLDGIPISIKDLIITKDFPTHRGSSINSLPTNTKLDAPVVSKIKKNGGIILGKTTTPEFGHKGTTQSIKYGETANPWNINTNAGGSSGGSCAAVASGMGPLSVGTDGGGSIRIPASFCGLFGHKPTFGKIPAYPISPFGTVANVGPISKTVSDSALLMNVIAKPDSNDWHSLPLEKIDYLKYDTHHIKKFKVGFIPTWGMDKYINNLVIETEVRKKINQSINFLKKDGLNIKKINNFSWPNNPVKIFKTLWYLGAANLAKKINKKELKKIDKNFLNFINLGKKYNAFDLMEAEEKRAENAIYLSYIFDKYDVLIGPTLPISAFSVERNIPRGWNQKDLFCWTPFTYPFNLTKNPASNLNCNFTDNNMPVGLQIVAPIYKDKRCFSFSFYLEKVFSLICQWPREL